MGYSTKFEGKLTFKNHLTLEQEGRLNGFLSQDCPESEGYVDLELTDNHDGLTWDGSGYTCGLVESVNWLTKMMRESCSVPFVLQGELFAQGENIEDRWRLVMENGIAIKVREGIMAEAIQCPYCKNRFVLKSTYDSFE